jgi:hypothetical protein
MACWWELCGSRLSQYASSLDDFQDDENGDSKACQQVGEEDGIRAGIGVGPFWRRFAMHGAVRDRVARRPESWRGHGETIFGVCWAAITYSMLCSLYATAEMDETCQVRIKGLFCFAGNVN